MTICRKRIAVCMLMVVALALQGFAGGFGSGTSSKRLSAPSMRRKASGTRAPSAGFRSSGWTGGAAKRAVEDSGRSLQINGCEVEFSVESDREAIVSRVDKKMSGLVVIPSKFKGVPVTKIDRGAFADCKSIKSLMIPKCVVEIGEGAFKGCSSLKSVKMPDRVRALGSNLFTGCASLESMTIPDGVTEVEDGVFEGCASLRSVKMPNSVTKINRCAFKGCTSLKSVRIPSGVTAIAYSAFEGCSALESVKIPDGVKDVDQSAFKGCVALNSECKDKVMQAADDTVRSHEFNSVDVKSFALFNFTIRILALPNGEYNTVVWRDEYEAPHERLKVYRITSDIASVANPVAIEAFPPPARLLSTKMVVFNDDVGGVFGAFRAAFHKAREWIEVGKKNGKTPAEPLDMNIDVPEGCATEIPNDEGAGLMFKKLSNSPCLKLMRAGFKFWFSDKSRVLLFRCGDVEFDFRWDVGQDEDMLVRAESACDEKRLLQLYTGRPGEAGLFSDDQKYFEMPLVKKTSDIPKWGCIDGVHASIALPHNLMVGMARCSDGSLNYFFNPNTPGAYLTTVLIFPDDSYDEAYHAIEEAFRTAVAWKSIAQKHHVLNVVKEMKIPCPESAAFRMAGTKGAVELLWKSVTNVNQDVMPTKFWFSVETRMNGNRQDDTMYRIWFGNDVVQKDFLIDDSTLAAMGSMNPRLALQALEAAIQGKAKEKSIFK